MLCSFLTTKYSGSSDLLSLTIEHREITDNFIRAGTVMHTSGIIRLVMWILMENI